MSLAKKAVELKGGTVTLMSLLVQSLEPDEVKEALKEKIAQAPTFFGGAPILIDFSGLEGLNHQTLEPLIEAVRESDVMPIAVRGASDELHEKLRAMNMPPLRAEDKKLQKEDDKIQRIVGSPRVESRPIRSGQQVYAQEGDLIVMANTSAGSELIADGSIHVYGPLRGRALCGVTGNDKARIFCESLEAELVSIAGNYKVLEEIPPELKGRRVQVWLDEQKLNIEPF